MCTFLRNLQTQVSVRIAIICVSRTVSRSLFINVCIDLLDLLDFDAVAPGIHSDSLEQPRHIIYAYLLSKGDRRDREPIHGPTISCFIINPLPQNRKY